MPKPIRKHSTQRDEWRHGKHRFEHWAVDNQVYFITARCRDRFPALAGEDAKAVFWDRFATYTKSFGFTPWVTSLLDNHYHTLGYLRQGNQLAPMIQRLHGSVAKLTNDLLRSQNIEPPWLKPIKPFPYHGLAGFSPRPQRPPTFWGDHLGHQYFDGCIRSEKQARLTYRYILTQSRRHGICADPATYPHTLVNVELERAVQRAQQLDAFLTGVPYARYQRDRHARGAANGG